MIVSAWAKVNWALNVTGRRADGYHELDMLMQSVSLCDRLYIEPDDALCLTCDRADIPCDERNLVMKAALALQRAADCTSGARIHLEKHIPSQAGLGGGSSDCAATLRALNELWGLNLSDERLCEIGLSLGADVPFCLTGGFQRAQGLGERLTPLPCHPGKRFLLVKPQEGLSTPCVFKRCDSLPAMRPADIERAAQALANADDELLARHAVNMLSDAAISLCPAVGELLARLRALGARFAIMSGSGSACAAIFAKEEALEQAACTLSAEGLWTAAVSGR